MRRMRRVFWRWKIVHCLAFSIRLIKNAKTPLSWYTPDLCFLDCFASSALFRKRSERNWSPWNFWLPCYLLQNCSKNLFGLFSGSCTVQDPLSKMNGNVNYFLQNFRAYERILYIEMNCKLRASLDKQKLWTDCEAPIRPIKNCLNVTMKCRLFHDWAVIIWNTLDWKKKDKKALTNLHWILHI